MSDSRAALTPTKDSNLSRGRDPSGRAGEDEVIAVNPVKSPFVTFGKTPPKVFQSKKLRLEFPSTGVSLVRMALFVEIDLK